MRLLPRSSLRRLFRERRLARALFEYRALQYSFLERDWARVRPGRQALYLVEARALLNSLQGKV